MAHFSKVVNNKVVKVIVAEQDFIDTLDGTWIQTSYNTRQGIHYGEDGLPDGKPGLRLNYGQPGAWYNEELDAFIFPNPEPDNPDMVLDKNTGTWSSKNGTCAGFSENRDITTTLDIDHLL